MWHKPCRTFHPWCPCIKTRCLSVFTGATENRESSWCQQYRHGIAAGCLYDNLRCHPQLWNWYHDECICFFSTFSTWPWSSFMNVLASYCLAKIRDSGAVNMVPTKQHVMLGDWHAFLHPLSAISLKTKRCHNANFVAIGGTTVRCHDNLRWCKWRQVWIIRFPCLQWNTCIIQVL